MSMPQPKWHGAHPLAHAMRTALAPTSTVLVFSFFVNLLTLVSPIYMLQIYDRVISTRNIHTLVALTGLAAALLLISAGLEILRSRVLVRAGLLFDRELAGCAFDTIHRGLLQQPNAGHVQVLRDIDVLREFLSGSGLITFCDTPWFPVFVAAAFLLHPWFGWLAIAGGLVIFTLALANEFLTKKQLSNANDAAIRASRSAG